MSTQRNGPAPGPGKPETRATRPRHPPQAACRGARATIAPQVAHEPVVTPPSRLNPDRPGPTDLLTPEQYRRYLVLYYSLPAETAPAEKHRRAWRAALAQDVLVTDTINDLLADPPTDLRTFKGVLAPAPTRAGDRWSAALHESGHAVAWHELFGAAAEAAIREVGDDESAGISRARGDEMMRGSFASRPEDVALAVAVGRAAQRLLAGEGPPRGEPAEALPSAASAGMWDASSDQLREDAEVIARFCIAGPVSIPPFWTLRYNRLRAAAESFVTQHASAILSLAAELYATGYVRLELNEVAALLADPQTPPALPAQPPGIPGKEL